jgi:hypothetical protein
VAAPQQQQPFGFTAVSTGAATMLRKLSLSLVGAYS